MLQGSGCDLTRSLEFGSLIAGSRSACRVNRRGHVHPPKRCKEVLFTDPDFIAPAACRPGGNPRG